LHILEMMRYQFHEGNDDSAVTFAILTSVGFQVELSVSMFERYHRVGTPDLKRMGMSFITNGVTKSSPEIPNSRVLSVGSYAVPNLVMV
jgi:hypothetical protein